MFGFISSILPVVSAVLPVVGKIFGKNERVNNVTQTRNDFVEAGYNPLTAVSSGALSGASSYVRNSFYEGALSVSTALNGIVDGYRSHQTFTRANELADLEIDLARQSLEDVRTSFNGSMDLSNVSRATVSPVVSAGIGSDGLYLGYDDPLKPLYREGRDPDLRVFGQRIHENPSYSGAQEVEDRYGDLVSAVYGLGVVGADLHHTRVIENARGLQRDYDRAYSDGQSFGASIAAPIVDGSNYLFDKLNATGPYMPNALSRPANFNEAFQFRQDWLANKYANAPLPY